MAIPAATLMGFAGSGVTVYSEVRSAVPVKLSVAVRESTSDPVRFSTVTVTGTPVCPRMTVVAAVSLLFHLIYFRHGVQNLVDLGVACVDAERILDGQVPGRDFLEPYGPARFYITALAFWIGGRSLLTFSVSIPSAIKVFNWLATMYKGSVWLRTPMIYALSFLFLFTIGGFSGLMLAIAPADIQYHDSYFVVAHFHYVLVPGSIFALMAGAYYWLPKWTGYMYNESLGKLHFWLSTIFVNVTFFPMHFLGLAGMPRRIPDYSTQFADFNLIASIGAIGFGLSQLVFVAVLLTAKKGAKADDRVWEGAHGLEWTVPSPAPWHTWTTPPKARIANEAFE